jgi:hypothetical protein
VSTSVNAGLSPQEGFIDALTIEGLLFVAFSMAFALASGKEGGRHPFFTQAWFGWLVVAAIGVVAASATASWWRLYGNLPRHGVYPLLHAYGLLFGVVVQPLFAAIINLAARNS